MQFEETHRDSTQVSLQLITPLDSACNHDVTAFGLNITLTPGRL